MTLQESIQLLEKLGPVGPLLALTSLAALALTAERTAFLLRERPQAPRVWRRLGVHLAEGNWGAAAASLGGVPGPLAAMARHFVSARQLPEDVRRRDCEALLGDWLTRSRGRIKTLVMLAQVAPLLGLAGTVLGMVDTFRVIEGSARNVDPSQLAGGIWEALLTTVAGLAISIPLLVVVRLLQSQLEGAANQSRILYAALERALCGGGFDGPVAESAVPGRASGPVASSAGLRPRHVP